MKRNELDAHATPSLESPQNTLGSTVAQEAGAASAKRRTGAFVIRTGIRAGDEGYQSQQDNEPVLRAV